MTDTNRTPFRSLDFLPKDYIDELNLLPNFSSAEKLTQSLLAIDASNHENLPSVKNFMIDFLRLLQTKTKINSLQQLQELQQLKSTDEQRSEISKIYQQVLTCKEIQPSLIQFKSTLSVKKFAIDFLNISNAPRVVFDELDELIVQRFHDKEITMANIPSFLLILAHFNDTNTQQTPEVVEFIEIFHLMFKFFKKYETKMNQEIYGCWIYREYLKTDDISLIVNLIAKIKLLTFEPKYQELVDRIMYDVLETLNDESVKPFLVRAQNAQNAQNTQNAQKSLLGISGTSPKPPLLPQKIRDFASKKNLENTDDNFLRLMWFLSCMEKNEEFSCAFDRIMMENETSETELINSISSLMNEFSTRLVWNQLQEQRMQTIKDWLFGIYNDQKVGLLVERFISNPN